MPVAPSQTVCVSNLYSVVIGGMLYRREWGQSQGTVQGHSSSMWTDTDIRPHTHGWKHYLHWHVVKILTNIHAKTESMWRFWCIKGRSEKRLDSPDMIRMLKRYNEFCPNGVKSQNTLTLTIFETVLAVFWSRMYFVNMKTSLYSKLRFGGSYVKIFQELPSEMLIFNSSVQVGNG